MATLPSRTANTNPASTVEIYGTDGVTDWRITIANLLKNPGPIGGGTAAAGTFLAIIGTTGAFSSTLTAGNTTITGTLQAQAGSGVGIAATDGTFHVHTATAGGVAADVDADEGVFESDGNTGVSILSPNNFSSNLYFGAPLSNLQAKLSWNNSTSGFFIGTAKAGASTIFRGDNNITNITLSGASGDTKSLFTGLIAGAASTTTRATQNMPAGTAPSSPVNGDVWFVGNDMLRRIGGVTKSITFS